MSDAPQRREADQQAIVGSSPLLQATQGAEEAIGFMGERGLKFAYVVDADRRLKGYVNLKDLKGKTGWVDEYLIPAATVIR